MPTAHRAAVPILCLTLAACGSTTAPAPPDPPDSGFPPTLSALTASTPNAVLYAPQYPLWTNGSVKTRTIHIPSGQSVNTANRAAWSFSDGTIFSKTFAYAQAGGSDRNIETRFIRWKNGDIETAVYQWRADQSDADLITGTQPVPVSVTDIAGNTFDHVIPSAAQCDQCHRVGPTRILGFNELQLNAPLPGGTASQLATLAAGGLLSAGLPPTPAVIPGDPTTRSIIGYFQGNCVQCHFPGGVFDLTYPNFFAAVVNQTGPSGATLLAPGNPGASALFTRFASGSMPPLGVQLVDQAFATTLQNWIQTHTFP